MSARIFQSVIVQLRELSPRTIGVTDEKGVILACSDLQLIGGFVGGDALDIRNDEAADAAVTEYTATDHTFRAIPGTGGHIDYLVFAAGTDETARTLCRFAYVALHEAKQRFDDNNDRSAFIRSILAENVLISDISTRAKDLQLEMEANRAVFIVRQLSGAGQPAVTELLRELFSDRQTELVIAPNIFDAVIVAQFKGDDYEAEQEAIIKAVEEKLSETSDLKYVIGVGTVARNLLRLADSYKEATVAIDIGRIFDSECSVVYYENLGLGRLIYQLPTRLCEMYLSEVFKKNPIEALDSETLFTIYRFFENNLNVSETSRRLFVHRNTLVYRLEKIKKLTGLDLREFDHAIVFKVALMVKRYLQSQEAKSGQNTFQKQ